MKRKLILLVEDEASVALDEARKVEEFGYETVIVDNGEQALEVATGQERPVDLVLMDIGLGKGMDGSETAQRILERRQVPILFLTSHADEETVEKVRGIARYGYVIKGSGDFVLRSAIEIAFELFAANERLRASEERYRRITAAVMDYFFTVYVEDGKATKTVHGSACIGVTGYSAEEFEADPYLWYDMIYPEDRDAVAKQAADILGGNEPYSLLHRIRRKDGELRWIANTPVLHRDPGGKLVSYDGLIRDITERKLAEEALRESEEKYRSLVEKVNEAIAIIQGGLIVFANPRLHELLGAPEGSLVGKAVIDFIWPEDRTFVMSNYDKRVAGEAVDEPYDFRIIGAGGKLGWIFLSATAILWKGKPATLNLLTDITERKLAEERIKILLEEKELLLREVHHRIKNNMNTMMGLLEMQSDLARDRSAALALQDAKGRLQSMGVLYDKLYRSDNVRELSVKKYLPALVSEIVRLFPNSDIVSIETEVEDFPLGIKKLSTLGIMVNELVTNVMKYAFKGRAAGRIRVSASMSGRRVTVAIEDDGVGIPEACDFAHSSGFGLRLVGMLASQLEGSARIDRGRGTKFVLEFDDDIAD